MRVIEDRHSSPWPKRLSCTSCTSLLEVEADDVDVSGSFTCPLCAHESPALRLLAAHGQAGVTATEAAALVQIAPEGATGDALIAATALASSPVCLGIFDWVVEWADAKAEGRESFMGRWNERHPLVRFGEAFWMEMCRAVFDWSGTHLPSHRRAVDLLMDHEERYHRGRRAENPVFSAELASLMTGLEDWLSATRTVSYDPDEIRIHSDPHMRQELAREIERTCRSCAEWATSVNLPDLAMEAERAHFALSRS